MKTAVETLEPTKVTLTVDVAWEDLKPAVDKAYRAIAGQINVPGFRKGKVPARIIDQRIGRGVVLEQAISDGLNGWYRAALDEHKLFPMDQAQVDVTEEADPTVAEPSFTFTATVEVRPEIKLPDLTKITVTVDKAEVTKADVDAHLDALRERFASLKTVDRPAQDGDYVTIDLKADIDDEEIDSVSGVSYLIGSGDMLEGLDEALIGLSAGETTTFEAPLAGGIHEGETALVTVTPQAVKERELPKADDDFAQLASEFDTVKELREDLKKLAGLEKQRAQVVQAQDELITHLLDTLDFQAPVGVVTKDAEARLERAGKEDDDEARVEFLEDSTKAVRTQLLVDALVDHLKVQANQGELITFMIQTSQQYGMDPSQFIQAAEQAGELPHFYAELVRNKASVAALRLITVKDKAGKTVDVAALLGPDPDAAAPAADGDEAAPAAPAAPARKARAKKAAPAADAAPVIDSVELDVAAVEAAQAAEAAAAEAGETED
ncbi:MAG: trigger factor [Bifidobacteriaceae bacterium]|nr:trigger factor [Bifidobacteriaceae bacterium]